MRDLGRSAAALSALVASLVVASCSPRSGPPIDRTETPLGSAWVSPRNRDHALVGKIFDVRRGTFVSEQELRSAVESARLLLLGEVHDNADHHLLQARLVRVGAAGGRRPAIAFEMLDETEQPAIDAVPLDGKVDANAIRDAVQWDESGWPEFRLYRPIFEAAIEAKLPIVAANLPRARIREASRAGVEALPASVRQRIERQGPLSAEARAELRAEMADSHCGELPDVMLDPLILGQRARDAQLADALARRATRDGAILIAGSGHARLDRGVASYLAPAEVEQHPVLSVAFEEVSDKRKEPRDYSSTKAQPRQFDFVVFTPGAEREDPCEKLRKQLKEMQRHPPVGQEPEGTRL